MKPAICFVDDDADEIRRFRKYLSPYYDIVTGATLEAAVDQLKDQSTSRPWFRRYFRRSKPRVILLDLYFGPKLDDAVRQEILAADTRLEKMERDLRKLMIDSGLKPEEGFELAKRAERQWPRVPRVFFSRRAFLEDVMKIYDMNLKLIEKPDPQNKETYDQAFERHADRVRSRIDAVISDNTFWARHGQRIQGFVVGFAPAVAKYAWDNADQARALGKLLGKMLGTG